MNPKGLKINHSSYADDLVFFTSGDKKLIKLIMNVLNEYQEASGQEINKEKSFFLTHKNCDRRINGRIRNWTRYKQAEFPFTYLGYPIYVGRKKVCYFSSLATKVLQKAGGGRENSFPWAEKLLL